MTTRLRRMCRLRSGKCKACGQEKPLSNEHAIPKWLGEAVSVLGRGPGSGVAHRYEGPPGVGVQRQWHAAQVDVKARLLCTACNNGPLARAESAVKPVLGSLVRGGRVTLVSRQCRELAVWFSKTALMIELCGDANLRVVSQSLEDWFRGDRSAPDDGLNLWLACTRLPASILTAGRSIETTMGNGVSPGWLFEMVFGHAVLLAISTSRGSRQPEISGPLANAVLRLWPAPLIVSYPPRQRLTAEQVSLLPYMFAQSAR